MKKQIFKIDHGTFPFDVLVCIGNNHEEVCKYIQKLGYKLNKDEVEFLKMEGSGRTVHLEGGQTVLRIKITKDKSLFHSNIAHEVFHAVEFLFQKTGIIHDVKFSGEAFAYQIGHLTKQIYKNYNP